MKGKCSFMSTNIPTKEQVRQLFTEKLAEISQGSADDKIFLSNLKSLRDQNPKWQDVSDAIQMLTIRNDYKLVRVAFTYSINPNGGNEFSRLNTETGNIVESIRSIVPKGWIMEFHVSFYPVSNGSGDPKEKCLARGILHAPSF